MPGDIALHRYPISGGLHGCAKAAIQSCNQDASLEEERLFKEASVEECSGKGWVRTGQLHVSTKSTDPGREKGKYFPFH